MCQVSGDVKIKIQLLKICQGPYIELFVKFEIYQVRLNWFSIMKIFHRGSKFKLCQVSPDAKNLHPYIENLLRALDKTSRQVLIL